MNKVEMHGGPDALGVTLKLNGHDLRDCTRIELVADANEDLMRVTFTVLAKVDVAVHARDVVILDKEVAP